MTPTPHRLAGKRALVTGAASGLGLAIAGLFAAHGAQVLMTDINAAALAARADELALPWQRHDVTSEADWSAALEAARSEMGGLTILVNNAGIACRGSVEDTSLADWQRIHRVDLDSVFLGCKTALPLIVETARSESGRGAIVNMSSIAGVIAAGNMAAYNSAKAAVRHLTKSVALHCAQSGYPVTCNSIHPVFIDTPILDGLVGSADREAGLAKLGRQIPLGRVGEPEDVAYAALYLASDEAKFVTGSELFVDGGIAAT